MGFGQGGSFGLIGLSHQLCHAEIEDFHQSRLSNEDVARLDIAMNYSLGVCRAERLGNGHSQFRDELSAHRSPARHIHSERLPIEIFHYDKFPAFVRVDIVDRANIRMVQRRSGAGLAAKAL